MGLFTREERMNKEGKFEVTKKGLFGRRESSTPNYDRLHRQAVQERKAKKLERRREYREAYEEARHKAKIARMKKEGSRVGSLSIGDRFNRMASGFSMGYSTRNNYNPWGSTFDTGMKPMKTSKKKKKKSSNYMNFDMTDNWGFMK